MLFKPTPRTNNINQNPAFISFLKHDKFTGYKKGAIILAAFWGITAFASEGMLIKALAVLLLIASISGYLILPKLANKHKRDQFVIEYQFGIHDVTEGVQRKIPWTEIVCFVNSFTKKDKKSGDYESVYYIITPKEHIKLDTSNYDEKQLQAIYGILGPYMNRFQRYVAGENLVRIELKDIDYIRKSFTTQQYLPKQ